MLQPTPINQRPLKILQVTEASFAGVGGHVLDLAGGLQELGCHCHVVFSARRTDHSFLARLRSLPLAGSHAVDMRRMPHWTDWSAYRQLRRYIAEHGPFDIIHGHSTKGGGLTRLLADRAATPVVYTPNGIYTMNATGPRTVVAIARWVERRLSHRSAAIISVSPEERLHICQLGLAPDRIHCIPNGLAPIEFVGGAEARRRLNLEGEAIIVGFLGRLASQKNPGLLLEAFARVAPTTDRPVRLALAGVGPLEQELRTLAGRLGIADRVHWLGFRTAAECLKAFDIFVLPSRYEGMPYVLMEAVTAGLPTIATAVGGASSCIDAGRNGMIVPPGEVAPLADALGRLIDSPPLRAEFSAAAAAKAPEFSVQKMIERTLELYWELIADAASGSSRSTPRVPTDSRFIPSH